MEVIDHDEIRMRIEIKLSVLKPFQLRDAGLTGPGARNVAVDAMMSVLNGTVTIRPSMIPGLHRLGTFGVDEPWPTGYDPSDRGG